MNSVSSPSVEYKFRSRVSDLADKHLFTAVFLIGTALIVGLKLLHAPQWVVTGGALACMLVYGIYILVTPRYRIRNDRAGDSLYYLGFLFTMVSLAYSLWEFSSERGGTQAIVTNFGIALATTILGLVLRVAYHQMREDPFEVERQVRIELSDAAGKMRGELLSAANAFKILSTGIRQSLQESSDSTVDHIKRVVDQTSDTYVKSVEGLAEIGKTHVAELEQHQAAMRKGAQRIAAAVDRLAERIETVKLPTENLTTQLDVLTVAVKATTTGISESLLSIETQLKAIEKLLADSQSHISKYAEHLKVLEVGVNAVSQKTEDISTALEKLAKAAAATSENTLQLQGDHLKAQKELSQELQASINQTLLAIRDHRTRLEENVKASDEIVTKVQDSFVGLVRNIRSELNT